jgi:hypothetical protein
MAMKSNSQMKTMKCATMKPMKAMKLNAMKLKAMKTMKLKAMKAMKTTKPATKNQTAMKSKTMAHDPNTLAVACQTTNCPSWVWLHKIWGQPRCAMCGKPWVPMVMAKGIHQRVGSPSKKAS